MFGRVYQSKFYRGGSLYMWDRQLDLLVFTASTAGLGLEENEMTSPKITPRAQAPGGHRRQFSSHVPRPLGPLRADSELTIRRDAPRRKPRSKSKDKYQQPAKLEAVPVLAADQTLKQYLASLPHGEISRIWVPLLSDACGQDVNLPVIVAKGAGLGPTFGLTAALHGNELNGVPLIFRLFDDIDLKQLCGTLIAVPITNPPGYLRNQRGYEDGQDLNRLFPGKEGGTGSQVFCRRLLDRIVSNFDFLLDLHTASFGRLNSLYVRADMNDPITARLALLQNPQIIAHNSGPDGSLRGAAADLGIPAVTVEIGNPQTFQRRYVKHALLGCANALSHLNMLSVPVEPPVLTPILCTRSYWTFTDVGGILQVFPELCAQVEKNQLVAEIKDLFGRVLSRIYAKEDGIVIGKNANPAASSGARILHLGITGTSGFPSHVDDGHP